MDSKGRAAMCVNAETLLRTVDQKICAALADEGMRPWSTVSRMVIVQADMRPAIMAEDCEEAGNQITGKTPTGG